jgi:acylphosphatase
MSRTEHVVIHGRVQGVGFRVWVQHQAQLHGLNGWVRNRRDGAVEAVISGPQDAVAVMLKACAQGPRGATVEHVEHLTDPVTVSDGFEILATR